MDKQKTNEEWSQIRFQNSIGPQIGGLIHDAVALTIAFKEDDVLSIEAIKNWLDALYEIAENKKKDLTEIKPVSEKAVKLGDKWKGSYQGKKRGWSAGEETEEINKKIQETVDEGREKEAEDKE